MTTMNLRAAALAAMAIMGGGGAFAADCLNGTSDLTCDTGSGDVCQWINFLWACQMDRHADTVGATAYAVLDSNGDYQAFGTDASGADFCCISSPLNGTDPEIVALEGGSYNDTLALQWTHPVTSTIHDLTNPSGKSLTGAAIGLGGNDTIRGSRVDLSTYTDELSGRAGDDTLTGYAGDDYIWGGEGQDEIFGDDGDDWLYGGLNNDTLWGGNGADNLYGGYDNDTLYGQSGDDSLSGERGDDQLRGGTGDDFLDGGRENDTLYGEDDKDILIGGDDDDRLEGGVGSDVLCGGRNDVGADILEGGDGDDDLWAPHGTSAQFDLDLDNDELDGGAGTDTCSEYSPLSDYGTCEIVNDPNDPANKPSECP